MHSAQREQAVDECENRLGLPASAPSVPAQVPWIPGALYLLNSTLLLLSALSIPFLNFSLPGECWVILSLTLGQSLPPDDLTIFSPALILTSTKKNQMNEIVFLSGLCLLSHHLNWNL